MASVRLFVVYLSLGLVQICEIEILRWGKKQKSRSGVREHFQPYHMEMLNPCHTEEFYEPHSSPIHPVNTVAFQL